MKKNLTIAGIVLGVILIICFVAFLFLRGLEWPRTILSAINASVSDTAVNDGGEVQDWVPFIVDDTYGSSPLSGFNLKQKEVKSASARNIEATASDADKTIESLKSKMPDYPFAEIPILKPAMVISAAQEPFDEDITMGAMFYTEATFDETLTFYRDTLKQYKDFKEEMYETDTGKSYTLSFVLQGKYEMNASVMVMGMPATTGYTCALNITVRVRGAAKVENVEVENRADGLPGNYPDGILPAFKVQEIFNAQGDSKGCYVQYNSSGSYKDAIDFYKNKLNDKTDFNVDTETEGETTISCLVPGWQIGVRIMDQDGLAYIEAECYIK